MAIAEYTDRKFLPINELETGEYYWVYCLGGSELIIGCYDPELGTINCPWQIVGSDNIYDNSEIKAVCKCGKLHYGRPV